MSRGQRRPRSGCSQLSQAFLALTLALAVTSKVRADEGLALTWWGTQTAIDLEQYRGSILVLDFFAHWCAPCLVASRELQSEIQGYYAERGGNPHKLPVRVLAVNIEPSQPARTAQFIARAGLTAVGNDAEGQVFARYGGTALPFIVVVNAAGDGPAAVAQPVATFEGHPGSARLREIIDTLRATPAEAASDHPASPGKRSLGQRLFPRRSGASLELSGEGLLTENYQLYLASAAWREDRPAWDYRLQVTGQFFDLHYEPAPTDFISQKADLFESALAFQGRLRGRWQDRWQAELSGGLYDGFQDYRSVWLDAYYRAYFEPVPGYAKSDPAGYHVAPGLRWEYVPGSAYLQATVAYQQDRVSPAYEKAPFQPLVRGTDLLHTVAGSLSSENLLSPSVRVRQKLQITDTTDRDLRYGYELLVNWAPSSSLVIRGTGGATLEPPDFYAYYGQLALDYDWHNRWFVGIFGRYYTDDGLVRDPQIVSSASPPLQTFRVGLALRYENGPFSCKIAAGPYFSRYDEVPAISEDFSTLYADRDWVFFEIATGIRF